MGGLDTEIDFLTVQAGRSKIKVLAGLDSSEGLSLWLVDSWLLAVSSLGRSQMSFSSYNSSPIRSEPYQYDSVSP